MGKFLLITSKSDYMLGTEFVDDKGLKYWCRLYRPEIIKQVEDFIASSIRGDTIFLDTWVIVRVGQMIVVT